MTKEELASALNGMHYREDIPQELLDKAKESGLVIIYGCSDDLMEVEGAIRDEGGCYGGGKFNIDADGLLSDREDMDDDLELEEWFRRKKSSNTIQAVWCAPKQPSWTYKTTIPHATFDVMEDGEVQCRGIVFNSSDL